MVGMDVALIGRFAAQVFGALALAMLIHEGGHYAAARLLRARDVRLIWDRGVLAVEAALPSTRAEAIFLMAGPAANLLCAVVSGVLGMPLFLLAHLACAAANLLPHAGSDGAKLLRRRSAPRRRSR